MVSVACTGPVSYIGHDELQTDIANLHKALAGVSGVVETFMPSTSPRGFGRNEYYATDREYYEAVGEALREEYLAIIEAGFLLQIDDPWLIEILSDPTLEPAERDRTAREHAEIVNHSLRGVPTEKIRLHTCYGLNHGPRVHDISMGEVAPYMLGIQAGGYSFEVANPRHMHEWKVWEDPAVRERAARRRGADPRPARSRPELRGAPGADRRHDRLVRLVRRARERHRLRRLRLLLARELLARGAPERRVGEVPRAVRGRRDRDPRLWS